MSNYTNQNAVLQINEDHQQMLGAQKAAEISALFAEMSLPNHEAGIIAVDIQIGKTGVYLFTILFNSTKEEICEKHIEFRLYDSEQDLAAAGYLKDAKLPILKPNVAHFWHFFVPFTAFVKSDALLRNWSLDVKGKVAPYQEGEEIETTRQYSFYQIVKPTEAEKTSEVKILPTKIKYDSNIEVDTDSEVILLSDDDLDEKRKK